MSRWVTFGDPDQSSLSGAPWKSSPNWLSVSSITSLTLSSLPIAPERSFAGTMPPARCLAILPRRRSRDGAGADETNAAQAGLHLSMVFAQHFRIDLKLRNVLRDLAVVEHTVPTAHTTGSVAKSVVKHVETSSPSARGQGALEVGADYGADRAMTILSSSHRHHRSSSTAPIA